MEFTAIGFSAENDGFCASRGVTTNDPQSVANYLKAEFDLYFDQILLMKNGDNSPEVVTHWNIDQDYIEEEE